MEALTQGVCVTVSCMSSVVFPVIGCSLTGRVTTLATLLAMATYGKVKPFNPKTDDWEVYQERLRFYMAANNITDATLQRSILLTVCGEQTFRLLRSLVPEGKLDADGITYDSLVGLLQSHYKKKQSVVVHRFNFNTRSRKPTETIADYIAALRELALNCSFGSKERLEEMLRDRLICGVNHHGIQRKLLSEGDLSYKDALALAQSIESAEDDAKKLGGTAPPQLGTVHHTQTSKPSLPSPPTCYRCGGPHLAPQCRHKDTECRYCKKKGHLARVCRAKGRPPATATALKRPSRTTHHVQQEPESGETEQVDSDSGNEYGLNAIQDEHSPPFTTTLYLNDTSVEMEIDTGAAVSIINEPTFTRVKQATVDLTLKPASSKLKTYTGQDITWHPSLSGTVTNRCAYVYMWCLGLVLIC